MSQKFFISIFSLLLWGFFIGCSNASFVVPVEAHAHGEHASHHHHKDKSDACEMHTIPVHLVVVHGDHISQESLPLSLFIYPPYFFQGTHNSLLYRPLADPDPPRSRMSHYFIVSTTRFLL